MKNAPLRFALYARVSTEAQEDEGQSLTTQMTAMRRAVESLGGVIARSLSVQESAMEGSDRPSLRSLLAEASKGQFDALMVAKLDRLSRAQGVLSHVEQSLRTMGLRLFVLDDEQDLQSAEGKLSRGVLALVGEYSVNRLKWSAAASRLERAKRGWPHSAKVPFGRMLLDSTNRQMADAQWVLDPAKAHLIARMYSLYIDEAKTFAQVGRDMKMNPETVRRILVEQSGGEWVRQFGDPATGEMVEVRTAMPPLFDRAQMEKIANRAALNQRLRLGWLNRRREYPLTGVVRCSNPKCGWSNLSGHSSTENGKMYSYYQHLSRSRQPECVNSIPANKLEAEVFSRLGQLLKSQRDLRATILNALKTGDQTDELEARRGAITGELRKEERKLKNAFEILLETRGTAAGEHAQASVNDLSKKVDALRSDLRELEDRINESEPPEDLAQRVAESIFRLTGLNGHMPMHWPHEAKVALIGFFFGGLKSTRFDRSGRRIKSGARGIFVSAQNDDLGARFWAYEARGILGDFAGALTANPALYDRFSEEGHAKAFSDAEVRELAKRAKGPHGAKKKILD